MWDSGWKRRNLGAHWLTHREPYRRRIIGVGVGDGVPEDRCGAVDAAGHRQGAVEWPLSARWGTPRTRRAGDGDDHSSDQEHKGSEGYRGVSLT